jgi:hypothetical protein
MICFCNGVGRVIILLESQLIIIQDSSMAHLASLMPDFMVLPSHLDVIMRLIDEDFVMAPSPMTHR